MTELNFDANVVEPTGKFEPIPIDDYLAIITASEMKDTKPKANKNPGKYLQLVFEIADGDYKGRKIFSQLNLVNDNTTTVEIAQRALSAICRCVGVLHPKDSAELHNKPLVISVGIRPASGEYEASNVIRSYSRTDGKELGDVVDSTPATKVSASPATTGAKPKPWQKNR